MVLPAVRSFEAFAVVPASLAWRSGCVSESFSGSVSGAWSDVCKMVQTVEIDYFAAQFVHYFAVAAVNHFADLALIGFAVHLAVLAGNLDFAVGFARLVVDLDFVDLDFVDLDFC